ncbi:MAG: hypothetical protein WDN28_03140 [Chthoniobacter sp.]
MVAVSLGAKVLVADYFSKLRKFAEDNNIKIECCLLDVPEVANMRELTDLDENQVKQLVQQQVQNMISVIRRSFPEATITKWSALQGSRRFPQVS